MIISPSLWLKIWYQLPMNTRCAFMSISTRRLLAPPLPGLVARGRLTQAHSLRHDFIAFVTRQAFTVTARRFRQFLVLRSTARRGDMSGHGNGLDSGVFHSNHFNELIQLARALRLTWLEVR
jgi:hypothetical protein